MVEHRRHPNRLTEHLLYTAITLVIGLIIAIPLGAWVGHTGRLHCSSPAPTPCARCRALDCSSRLDAVGPLSRAARLRHPEHRRPRAARRAPLLSGVYAASRGSSPRARRRTRHGNDGLAGADRSSCPARCRSRSRLPQRDPAGHRDRNHRGLVQPRRSGPLPDRRAGLTRPRADGLRLHPRGRPRARGRPSCLPAWRGVPCRRESPGGLAVAVPGPRTPGLRARRTDRCDP